jgi:hypothetical protein
VSRIFLGVNIHPGESVVQRFAIRGADADGEYVSRLDLEQFSDRFRKQEPSLAFLHRHEP